MGLLLKNGRLRLRLRGDAVLVVKRQSPANVGGKLTIVMRQALSEPYFVSLVI
jgi:hypothetical protein